MNLHILRRDGAARLGEVLLDETPIQTPAIVCIDPPGGKPPACAEIIITTQKPKKKKYKQAVLTIEPSLFTNILLKTTRKNKHTNVFYPKDVTKELHLHSLRTIDQKTIQPYAIIPACLDILDEYTQTLTTHLWIVAYAKQAFTHQSSFARCITTLRRKIGYDVLLYVPSLGEPTNLSLLTYMGVDFFDSMTALISARHNIFLFPTGNYPKSILKEVPCCCPACTKANYDPEHMGFSEILAHNYAMLFQEIRLIKNAIHHGRLRELVEQRVRSNPHQAALLRILDSHEYCFYEERMPIIRKTQLLATTKDALNRPEIRRFQDRLLHRYEKPRSANILLILPCSARKPYSFSPSHKRFQNILWQVKNQGVVHELIITSPLGLVPRELELVYPAAHYDIAVTGVWDEDEKKMIRNLFKSYLEKNTYDKVIVHLPVSLQEIITDLIPDPLITCTDEPTSEKSLTTLLRTLLHHTKDKPFVDQRKRIYENVYSLACYQFDKRITEKLFKDAEIRGKYPYYKIKHKNIQLGMLTQERGLISLTLEGAYHIGIWDQYWVELHEGFPLKGSIFAPGIIDADVLIREGDEVVALRKNTICGVGVALMNGSEMKQLHHGEAVKLRHHI